MTDERKAFEAWYESPTRPFCESDTSAWGAAWAAWQARAALSAPPREPVARRPIMCPRHPTFYTPCTVCGVQSLRASRAPSVPLCTLDERDYCRFPERCAKTGCVHPDARNAPSAPAREALPEYDGVVEALRELVEAANKLVYKWDEENYSTANLDPYVTTLAAVLANYINAERRAARGETMTTEDATAPPCDHDFQRHVSTQLRGPVRCGTCGAIVNAPVNTPAPAPIDAAMSERK
jgi:hypothetical protein